MIWGSPAVWTRHFVSADQRLLERIAVIWSTCLAVLPPQPEEDDITIQLVDLLGKDPVVRRICHWIEYQFEPFGTAPNGAKFSKGKIDMAILLDQERERYLAYECKRLNVIHRGKRSSLATPYVSEGMMRFMTEQYAESLPIGCMLGYVIDGDTSFARTQLARAIASHPPLLLKTGPTMMPPLTFIERFSTTHNRSAGMGILLRHALLPFPVRPSS